VIVPTGRIFDTAAWDTGAALPGTTASPDTTGADVPNINFGDGPVVIAGQVRNARVKLTDPRGGYRYAVDNFLCETTNFFLDGITSIRSARQDQFKQVTAGEVYKSTLRLFRSAADATDDSRWDMYSRASAFGVPLATRRNNIGAGAPYTTRIKPTFSHVLPPYYSGDATAELIYTASYTGAPTVSEILSELKIRYRRVETSPNYSASVAIPTPGINSIIPALITSTTRPGYSYPEDKRGGRLNDPRMQIDSSFNLKEHVSEVPVGTATQKDYWLIQSKFETPILNFANVSQENPVGAIAGSLVTNQTGPDALKTVGMWHQYGSVITSSTAGVFAQLNDAGGEQNSLADVVGFQKGVTFRVGDVKKNAVLEEAIVAIPFRVVNAQRQFFAQTETTRERANYARLVAAMDKYIFPPLLDFVKYGRTPPAENGPQEILMYVFEFAAEIDQGDIADMWQNLPPTINTKIIEQEVIVEDRELLNLMGEESKDIRWMVFKVKKRAEQDYNIYRRSLVSNDTSALAPMITGDYSYNWPYDYFSLVELAKIEATAQWTSTDMRYVIDEDVPPAPVAGAAARMTGVQGALPCLDQTQIEQILGFGGTVAPGRGCPGTTHYQSAGR
jgi:hypothetical protein